MPGCAIGAPAKTFYIKAQKKYSYELIVPENYEVANAVGAATAGIQEVADAIVRPGEEGFGFLVHVRNGRHSFSNKEEAIEKAVEMTKEIVATKIVNQNLELGDVLVTCKNLYMGESGLTEDETKGIYVGTNIKVSASGKVFI